MTYGAIALHLHWRPVGALDEKSVVGGCYRVLARLGFHWLILPFEILVTYFYFPARPL